jgi:periplasmic divalent cation tolerance protein
MNANDYCIVITTTDNEENAKHITQVLLEENLAACIQRTRINSAYRWEGRIITSEEIRLDIKTKTSLFSKVKERIEQLHIYDVPEILMFRVDDAKFEYLRWVDAETL